jgi:alpha-mannosidase
MDAVSYPSWPVLEFRFRVAWNEERRRLKLRIPTALDAPALLAEVPGGAILRPGDGEERVHGRWLVIAGRSAARSAAIGIASTGQHGLDFKDGEIRLSVLRSSAYCHEQGFDLDAPVAGMGKRLPGRRPRSSPPAWKFADIGVHEFRLLATAGGLDRVKSMMPGLADYLAAPPAVFAHLPYDAERAAAVELLLALSPSSIRLLACKRSLDGRALVIRIQEAAGRRTKGELTAALPPSEGKGRTGSASEAHVPIDLGAFEIRTLRIEKDGAWRSVRLVEEDAD